MKIQTKLTLNIFLIVFLLIFFIIVMIVNFRVSTELRNNESIAREVSNDVADLNLIMYEYLLYNESRMENQWLSLNEKIKSDISTLPSNKFLPKINEDIDILRVQFKRLIKNKEEKKAALKLNSDSSNDEMSKKIEERLISQLIVQSSQTASDISRYADSLSKEIDSTKLKTDLGLLICVALAVFVTGGLLFYNGRTIKKSLISLKTGIDDFKSGNLKTRVDVKENDELGEIASAFNSMVSDLNKNRELSQKQDWIKSGIVRLNKAVSGDLEISDLGSKVISEITRYIGGKIGAIYLLENNDKKRFSLAGSYAYKKRKGLPAKFKFGEGLVGQAAEGKKQIIIKNVPENYIRISSGLSEIIPECICLTPIIRENSIKGVIEIGMLSQMTKDQQEYLTQAIEVTAVAVETAQNRAVLAKSLEKSQAMSEELQAQQEELKTSNEMFRSRETGFNSQKRNSESQMRN